MSQKIIEALKQCSQNDVNVFEMEDEFGELFSIDDEDDFTFGLVGTVTKKLRQLVEKIKCSLRVIGETVGNGDLKDVFLKFRHDIVKLLKNDVKECIHTEGVKAKVE